MHMLTVGMVAASDAPALIVAYVMAGAAVLGAVLTFIVNRRTTTNTYQLGIIEAAQEGMKDALAVTRADLAASRDENVRLSSKLDAAYAEIKQLRREVDGLRGELAVSLRHHDECEGARAALGVELLELRTRLAEGDTPP